MKILVVEDNTTYRNHIVKELQDQGYLVDFIVDFSQLKIYNYSTYDLILLDISLPNYNGIDLIDNIKNQSNSKIFMLTSNENKTTEFKAIVTGADDYITKPHYLPLLIHKINLLNNKTSIVFKSHIIDLQTMRIDNEIKLTKQEYQVLIHLLHNRNTYCTKDQLLDLLWENNFFIEIDALYSLIYRLRKKLRTTAIIIENSKGAYCIHD